MSKEVDVKTAQKFLRTLVGGASANEFVFQTFADQKSNGKRAGLTAVLHGTLQDRADQLADFNARGAGIFVTINATRGGGRKAKDFEYPRALWADMDGVRVPRWPLAPSMIVETSPGKFHFYWVLADRKMPLETWRACMARIVAKYKADGNATDPVRVLRVPGFFHRKGDPVRVRLAHCAGASYSTEEIVKAFPPVKSVAPKPRVVQPQPDIDLEALRSALEHLAATPISNKPNAGTYVDDYETWMRFGLALKRDLGEEGFDIWEEWSEYSERYPGRDTLRAKWEKGFKTDDDDGGYGHCVRPIHVGSIFFTAQRRGWSTTRFRIAKALTDARGAFA